MRWCGALPALLCGGGSRSLHSERRRHWRRALSAGGRRRVVASFRAVTVALLSQRGCSRRSSCAPRVCRAAASDAAVWRSATAPLQRRFALSARRRSQHTMPAPHRRRLALTSGSRADRTARCVAHHARNACAPSASRADRTHCAPSAHDSRAHTATIAPGAPRRSAPPPSPPSPHTRFRLARRPHRTVRSTPRTQHIVRLPLRAPTAPQHCAPCAHDTRTHTATIAPICRDAALPLARRRLALASGSRADRTARRATRRAHAAHCAPS